MVASLGSSIRFQTAMIAMENATWTANCTVATTAKEKNAQ
jgi:hypothetical protein